MSGPRLYGLAEFAEKLGWDRRKLSTYIARGKMPEPYEQLASGPVWTEEQVMSFMQGEIVSGKDLEAWPVRLDKKQTPYLLGRLHAVIEEVLGTIGHPSAAVLASEAPATKGAPMMAPAIQALGRMPEEKSSWYNAEIESIMINLTDWPETLTSEEQSDWWLGYYHERGRLRSRQR